MIDAPDQKSKVCQCPERPVFSMFKSVLTRVNGNGVCLIKTVLL